MKKDAFGNNIELNQNYIYISSSNGIKNVLIGSCVKINNIKVSLTPLKKGLALYEKDIENIEVPSKLVSVSPNILIPFYDSIESIKW